MTKRWYLMVNEAHRIREAALLFSPSSRAHQRSWWREDQRGIWHTHTFIFKSATCKALIWWHVHYSVRVLLSLCFCVHHQRDVSFNQRKGEELDTFHVLINTGALFRTAGEKHVKLININILFNLLLKLNMHREITAHAHKHQKKKKKKLYIFIFNCNL